MDVSCSYTGNKSIAVVRRVCDRLLCAVVATISSLYLHSKCGDKPPLRVGVLVDDLFLPAAFRRVLSDVLSSDFARLELVVVRKNSVPVNKTTKAKTITQRLQLLRDANVRNHVLYAIYEKFDSLFTTPPDPLEMVDCTDILACLPRLDVVPIAKRFVHRFPPEAVEVLKSYNLDLLLRFGFGILRGEVLKSSQYGIWSYHHGDNEFYRGGPPMFWELAEGSPHSGVVLQILTEELDNGLVLYKGIFPTKRGLWRHDNMFAPFWGSTHFVIRKLHELHERGWDYLETACLPAKPYQGKTAIYRIPDNFQFARWFVPSIARKAIRAANPFRKTKRYHWRICLGRNDSCRLSRPGKQVQYNWLSCPSGHMYADPFLLEKDGKVWLFLEDYYYKQERAVIRCAEVQADLSVGPMVTCLDMPYHLSYPSVFLYDGEIFMIPETARNNGVELWRATSFPNTWKLEKTLFPGLLMDTTPIRYGGRWYFFTTIAEPRHCCAFGALFWANELTGDWVHHPNSPITMDVRYARSAGAIHEINGGLFRPVQDCGENYGRRIHVNEILHLDPDTYREARISTIEPDWEEGLLGTHTYNYCNGIEVLDGAMYVNEEDIYETGTEPEYNSRQRFDKHF